METIRELVDKGKKVPGIDGIMREINDLSLTERVDLALMMCIMILADMEERDRIAKGYTEAKQLDGGKPPDMGPATKSLRG